MEWSVTLDQMAADALEIMRAEDLSFVPVTAPARGGSCESSSAAPWSGTVSAWGMTQRSVPLQHHLKKDVRFVFTSDEPDRDVVQAAASQPVVVVNAALVRTLV